MRKEVISQVVSKLSSSGLVLVFKGGEEQKGLAKCLFVLESGLKAPE